MKLRLVRVPNGYAFADSESAEAANKHKVGTTVLATVVKPRSSPFQRKFFSMLRFAYDYWEPDVGAEPQSYKGHVPEKNFERFRSDVTILCGFYRAVYAANGELRLEALSIAFDEMEPADFERLYTTAIGVLLRLVLSAKGFSEAHLREAVDHLQAFDS